MCGLDGNYSDPELLREAAGLPCRMAQQLDAVKGGGPVVMVVGNILQAVLLVLAGGLLGLVARRGVRARLRRQAVRGYEPRRAAA